MSHKMRELKGIIKQAQKNLCAQAVKDYPIGTLLSVVLGGHMILLEVTGHNKFYWCDAGTIYGENVATGKHRSFDPTFHTIKGVTLPGGTP